MEAEEWKGFCALGTGGGWTDGVRAKAFTCITAKDGGFALWHCKGVHGAPGFCKQQLGSVQGRMACCARGAWRRLKVSGRGARTLRQGREGSPGGQAAVN